VATAEAAAAVVVVVFTVVAASAEAAVTLEAAELISEAAWADFMRPRSRLQAELLA